MDLITVNYVQDLSPILTKRRRLEPETKAAQTNIQPNINQLAKTKRRKTKIFAAAAFNEDIE